MADNTVSTVIEIGGDETAGLIAAENHVHQEEETKDESGIPPSNVPDIPLRHVHSYKPGEKAYPFLPRVPVMVTVTARTGRAASGFPHHRPGVPRLRISLEHGPFKWTVDKFYRDILSLRRDLLPLGDKLRKRRREKLPPLLKMEDINVRQGTRLRKQVPKVQTFLNAVLSNRTFRGHPATVSTASIL